MARIFISSRMRELFWERKQVVELLNFGEPRHTPLFFEQEPWVTDPDRAKEIIDRMLTHSDAFLQLHYLTSGTPRDAYEGKTAVEYEFSRFSESAGRPCMLLKKRPEESDRIEHRLANLQDTLAQCGVHLVEFSETDELAGALNQALRGLDLPPDPPSGEEGLILRYTGRDFIGLLGAITSVLFHGFRLNVTFMSYAAVGGWGALLLTCAPREALSKPFSEVASEVEAAVAAEIELVAPVTLSEQRMQLGISTAQTEELVHVTSLEMPKSRSAESYIEVRHVDLPGQVAAICTAIKKLDINIDELQLHCVDPGLERERVLRLWVSHGSSTGGSPGSDSFIPVNQSLFLRLEAALFRLVGVRAVEVRHLTRGL